MSRHLLLPEVRLEAFVVQGNGKFTSRKLAGFAAALRQNLIVVSRSIRAEQYFHFDLNAGCGYNEVAKCDGSPIMFRQLANEIEFLNAFSFCCEIDRQSASKLAELTRYDHRTFVVAGSNQRFVEMIPDIIRRFGCDPGEAFGSILIDPNDHNREAIPYKELRVLSARCPRLDIFFNWPYLAIKRVRGAANKGFIRNHEALRDVIDIDELPAITGKRHLWIAEQVGNFVLVVGRNTAKINKDRSSTLEPWESVKGRYYRERCRLPADEADRLHKQRMEIVCGQRRLFE